MLYSLVKNHVRRFITNRAKCCYKSRQLLLLYIWADLSHIGAVITNRDRYYKWGQLLQIGAQHRNRYDDQNFEGENNKRRKLCQEASDLFPTSSKKTRSNYQARNFKKTCFFCNTETNEPVHQVQTFLRCILPYSVHLMTQEGNIPSRLYR